MLPSKQKANHPRIQQTEDLPGEAVFRKKKFPSFS
jgi:hypothetical protein